MSESHPSHTEPMTRRLASLIPDMGLAEEDMVTDIIILGKVVNPDGRVSISVGMTCKQDWITRDGMLGAAIDLVEHASEWSSDGED